MDLEVTVWKEAEEAEKTLGVLVDSRLSMSQQHALQPTMFWPASDLPAG